MYIINTLVPLLALMLLGAALRRTAFVPPGFFQETNRLLYWIALPCLLFYQTAEATIEGDAALRVFLVLLAGMIFGLVLGYIVAWALRVPAAALGAFVQGTFRGNLAFVGLPVVLFALAAPDGKTAPGLTALAVLAIAFLVPIYNATAVAVLLGAQRSQPHLTRRRIRELIVGIASNPLVLSSLAGLVFAVTAWKLPPVLRQTCATLGQMTTPLALLGIGAALTPRSVRTGLKYSGAAALIKVAAAPLAGWLLAPHLGLAPAELRIAMLYLCCPTAVASYVMARQLGSDDELAGNIIVVSTLLSIPALAVALLIT
ncbi:MAG: AEC family transporter [Chloroflexi bacterium]|nr:AEC family transporter [Chloroflexota bacterium]